MKLEVQGTPVVFVKQYVLQRTVVAMLLPIYDMRLAQVTLNSRLNAT
jgi:hypothetical protein